MKISRFVSALTTAGLFACYSNAVSFPESTSSDGRNGKALKVLMIGNSFSASVLRETPKLAKAEGLSLDIVQCGIGGCPLDKHWANVERSDDMDFKPYGISTSFVSDPGRKFPKKANVTEMLSAEKWDIVTIQQASHKSAFYDTYEPYAGKLIAKIRELAPHAEIAVQETWSYSPYDTRLSKWKMTPGEMYEALRKAYAQLAAKYGLRTIPTGDAVQLFRGRLPVVYGELLTRDAVAAMERPAVIDFHGDIVGTSEWKQGNKGYQADWKEVKLRNDFPHLNARGHYLQACVWLGFLFNVDPTTFSYCPENLAQSDAKLMRECSRDALQMLALKHPEPRRQGALWTDTDGYPINAHGGGILHHEGTYYWYGEHKVYGNAGNWAHVGVHVYSSVNLCDWKDEGVAFSVDENPESPVGDGCIIERPKVVFCRRTGKFVMYFHLEKHERRARLAAAGVAISDSPAGPFSLVKVERPEGADCRDMNLFADDDGSCWHVFSSESNNTAHIVRLSDDFLSYAGPSHRIFVGDRSEAMALFKRDGTYWCICSGCTGWAPNEARYYRAENLAGPWERMGNPCTGVNPMNGFGPEKTWGGQSSAVFRVEGADRFVAMFDIWNPKNQLDSRYIWQEIVFTEKGIEIPWCSEWRAIGRNGEK